MSTLKPRQPVPQLTLPTLDGEQWNLLDQTPEQFTVMFFYRGYHCPVCRRQLRDVDRHIEDFEKLGVQVIAISSNPKELAYKTQEEWELKHLKIGYNLRLDEARQWGLYISNSIKPKEPQQFSEPGIFIIRSDGTLYAALIQSMPFARPTTKSLVAALDNIIQKDYPARGEA